MWYELLHNNIINQTKLLPPTKKWKKDWLSQLVINRPLIRKKYISNSTHGVNLNKLKARLWVTSEEKLIKLMSVWNELFNYNLSHKDQLCMGQIYFPSRVIFAFCIYCMFTRQLFDSDISLTNKQMNKLIKKKTYSICCLLTLFFLFYWLSGRIFFSSLHNIRSYVFVPFVWFLAGTEDILLLWL